MRKSLRNHSITAHIDINDEYNRIKTDDETKYKNDLIDTQTKDRFDDQSLQLDTTKSVNPQSATGSNTLEVLPINVAFIRNEVNLAWTYNPTLIQVEPAMESTSKPSDEATEQKSGLLNRTRANSDRPETSACSNKPSQSVNAE